MVCSQLYWLNEYFYCVNCLQRSFANNQIVIHDKQKVLNSNKAIEHDAHDVIYIVQL